MTNLAQLTDAWTFADVSTAEVEILHRLAGQVLNSERIQWCRVHRGPEDHTGGEPCDFFPVVLLEVSDD